MFGVWKQVIWAETHKIEFADIIIVEIVSFVESDMKRIVAILAH
jgi:hypothetical protein